MSSYRQMDPWSATTMPLQAPRHPSGVPILVFAIIGIPIFPFALAALFWSMAAKRQCNRGRWTLTGVLQAGHVISVIWTAVLVLGFLIDISGALD